MIEYIIAFILCGIVAFGIVYNEKRNIREWLLYAVVEAEKSLGNKTGQLKLRQVYDLFLAKFPIISKFIPFYCFSHAVDCALDEMKMLLKNTQIENYVKGDKE